MTKPTHSPATHIDSFHQCKIDEINEALQRHGQRTVTKFEIAREATAIVHSGEATQNDFSLAEAADIVHQSLARHAILGKSRCGRE